MSVMTNKERHVALLEVVEFAKSHGFPMADIAYWDPECPEHGGFEINEILMDHDYCDHVIGVGVFLNANIMFTKEMENDIDEIPLESIYPAEGIAP